ncbi:Gfo/Idh/MocA family oxidoreductase [Lactovum odontotermitis]
MKKLKTATIGLGRLGMVHTEHLAAMVNDIELKASFALDDNQLHFAEENFGVTTYKDWKEMIDKEDLDAVIITSPTGFHPEMTIYALEAGLHVFCEKPMGLDLTEVEKMAEVIRRHPKQIFQLGFMRRFDSSYQEAKRMVENGELGDIIYMRGYGIDPIKNFDGFVKFASDNDSGGVFLDMCIHDIDLVRWFAGKNPVEAWAVGNTIVEPKLAEIGEYETGVATLRFDNNMVATLVGGRSAAHGNHVEFEIMGSKGWIRVGQEANPYYNTLFTSQGIVRPYMQSFPERFAEAFTAELKAFVEAVKSGSPSKTAAGVDAGIATLKIAKACKQSAESGKLIQLNL